MDLAGIIVGAIGILVTIISSSLAYKFHRENIKLKKLSKLRDWLNSSELDNVQKRIWNNFNAEGGVIYDTKIFSDNYPAEEEYAFSNVSSENQMNFTRILTLETKNKRETARKLFLKKTSLNKTRQKIDLYHNHELTDIYLSTNQIVPEPTYNFLLNTPVKSDPEAIFAWTKSGGTNGVAGFEIVDKEIINKLESTHSCLINRCRKITSLDIIDEYAQKEYDVLKHRFSKSYTDFPEKYDTFAHAQINNSNLVQKLIELINGINKSGLKVIDVGCGTGIILNKLANEFPNYKFIGVDPIKQMLDIAKHRNEAQTNVSFIQNGVEDLNSHLEKYDVVISTWGFFNWIENGSILEKLTAKGGKTIVVNNWGSDDDFHKLWPEPALKFFKNRLDKFAEYGYQTIDIQSRLNLASDKDLFAAISLIFGKYTMLENIKDNFIVKIVIASKVNH